MSARHELLAGEKRDGGTWPQPVPQRSPPLPSMPNSDSSVTRRSQVCLPNPSIAYFWSTLLHMPDPNLLEGDTTPLLYNPEMTLDPPFPPDPPRPRPLPNVPFVVPSTPAPRWKPRTQTTAREIRCHPLDRGRELDVCNVVDQGNLKKETATLPGPLKDLNWQPADCQFPHPAGRLDADVGAKSIRVQNYEDTNDRKEQLKEKMEELRPELNPLQIRLRREESKEAAAQKKLKELKKKFVRKKQSVEPSGQMAKSPAIRRKEKLPSKTEEEEKTARKSLLVARAQRSKLERQVVQVMAKADHLRRTAPCVKLKVLLHDTALPRDGTGIKGGVHNVPSQCRGVPAEKPPPTYEEIYLTQERAFPRSRQLRFISCLPNFVSLTISAELADKLRASHPGGVQTRQSSCTSKGSMPREIAFCDLPDARQSPGSTGSLSITLIITGDPRLDDFFLEHAHDPGMKWQRSGDSMVPDNDVEWEALVTEWEGILEGERKRHEDEAAGKQQPRRRNSYRCLPPPHSSLYTLL